MATEWIVLSDVGRREVDPVIYDLLNELTRDGWRLRRQGHKFYVFCPCGDLGGRIRIDGIPRTTRPFSPDAPDARRRTARTGTTSTDDGEVFPLDNSQNRTEG